MDRITPKQAAKALAKYERHERLAWSAARQMNYYSGGTHTHDKLYERHSRNCGLADEQMEIVRAFVDQQVKAEGVA